MPLDAETIAELDELHAAATKAKSALKGLVGQQRLAIQLLADLDDRLWSLKRRLESTAKEAQDSESFSGTELFV
jgi:hypothetical protein